MSEHTPITGELREAVELEPTFCGPDRAMVPQPEFDSLCDAIDAVHAGLERENAELRERLAVLDNRSDSMHIGGATVTITDELRKWGYGFCGDTHDVVTDIADRIDAEHQKALDEWKAKHGQMWLKGYSECHAELLEGNETLVSDLEGCGWVRLPLGADNVPIRAGDVLDGYGKTIEVVELRHGRSGWVLISRDGNGYADCAAFTHHHAPTVEDVLREFGRGWHEQMNGPETFDIADYVERYAAKLRLAGDAG